jgi:hypothetical protein
LPVKRTRIIAERTRSSARPAPIPSLAPLPSAFWQALLYGNPDNLVGGADATVAWRLVADQLGVSIEENETIPTLRGGELRKLLRNKFGHAQAEQTMAALWRAAPPSPGAPGLTQRALGTHGGLVFLGQALSTFAIGFLGGDPALLAGQIPKTGSPIFRERMTPDAGHRLITDLITSIGVLANPLKYNFLCLSGFIDIIRSCQTFKMETRFDSLHPLSLSWRLASLTAIQVDLEAQPNGQARGLRPTLAS